MVGMENTASVSKLTAVSNGACSTCITEPAVMPVPEAARLLRASRAYLYTGIREGRFPGVRVGRVGLPMSLMRGFVADVIERGESMSFEAYAAAWTANAKAAA
jgi:excisionase family DNA binding protein